MTLRRAQFALLAAVALLCARAPALAQGEPPDEPDVLAVIGTAAGEADVASPLPPGATPEETIDAVEPLVRTADEAGAEIVLLGVPSRTQRAEVARLARLVLVLSDQAMNGTDAALSRPGPQTDETRRLAVARETVLPLRAARACLWLAACTDSPQDRAAWASHAESIAGLTAPLTTWAVAERGIVIGLADVLLGDPEGALEALAEARDTIHDTPALRHYGTLDLEANLATVLATAGARSPTAAHTILDRLAAQTPFTSEDGVRDWGLALLGADVAHRVGMAHAALDDNPSERSRVVERSILRYASLIGDRRTTETDVSARRRDIDERIRRVIDATDADPARLPAIAVAAVAAGADASDPTQRSRGIAMLERTMVSPSFEHDPFAPDVLFQIARLRSASDDPQDAALAAHALLRFAALAPTDARAPSALAAACAAALKAPPSQDARALSLRALRAALAHPGRVPHADTWRLELARLLIQDTPGQPIRSRWPAMLEASDALRGIEGEGRFTGAQVLTSLWLECVDRIPQDGLDAEWRERVGAAGVSEANAAMAVFSVLSSAQANRALAGAALLGAESQLILNQPQAALNALASVDPPTDPVLAARTDRARFLALIALGRVPEAFDALDAFATVNDEQAVATLTRLERETSDALEPSVRGFPPEKPGPGVSNAADILARAVGWRGAHNVPIPDALLLNAARALLFAGRAPDAARLATTDADRPPLADTLLVLGEAYLAAHEEAAAFDAFRRVVVALEPSATDARTYWHAWTRMLEILQRRNHQGARSADIRREIARLRTLDSWGAFPDCTHRIEAVGRAVGP